MGNVEILKRGDLQLTSAGTGIRHSEKAHGPSQVHFLQIWSIPSVPRLQPKYFTRHFSDAEKADKWATVVGPVNATDAGVRKDEREGAGPAPVQSALFLYATLLSPGNALPSAFRKSVAPGASKKYIHVVQTSGYNPNKATGAKIRVSDDEGVTQELSEGDGAYIMGEAGKSLKVENIGDRVAEVLLFDVDVE
jgi:quercetin 2,3-dioxygenase